MHAPMDKRPAQAQARHAGQRTVKKEGSDAALRIYPTKKNSLEAEASKLCF